MHFRNFKSLEIFRRKFYFYSNNILICWRTRLISYRIYIKRIHKRIHSVSRNTYLTYLIWNFIRQFQNRCWKLTDNHLQTLDPLTKENYFRIIWRIRRPRFNWRNRNHRRNNGRNRGTTAGKRRIDSLFVLDLSYICEKDMYKMRQNPYHILYKEFLISLYNYSLIIKDWHEYNLNNERTKLPISRTLSK